MFAITPDTTRQRHFLMLVHSTANIAIGMGLLFFANISAENILSRFGPVWLWPCMFISAGIVALLGVASRKAAQFAYVFAGIITGVVGLASLWAVVIDGRLVAIPTTVFLLYIMFLKFIVSGMMNQRDEVVRQINQTTEYGQSVLDRVSDGANTDS